MIVYGKIMLKFWSTLNRIIHPLLLSKTGRLNKTGVKFCDVVIQLDRIPRYGRFYRIDPKTMTTGKAEWEYQKLGRWGTYLLDDLDLLWKHIEHYNPDIFK